MLRVDPLRMQAEVFLQCSENSADLIGSERTPDRQVFQRRIREFYLDVRITADIRKNFCERLAGID